MFGNQFQVSIVRLLKLAALLTLAFSLLTGFELPHRTVELFSHFRLQYFAVSALLALVFVFLKIRTYTVALLLVTLFNGSFLLEWYLPPRNVDHSAERLTLVHANVHASSNQYQPLLDMVANENPDIVFLQEVDTDWAFNTKPLLRSYPHAYVQPRLGNFGIAVYSKIPFDEVRHVDSPPLGYPTIIARLTIAGQTLTFVSSHPTIPFGQSLYDARNEQLQSLATEVSNLGGARILLGDFNTSMWTREYRHLLEKTGLRDARRGLGVIPTWPVFLPIARIPIDHVLISEEFGVVAIRAGQDIGSDHLPLIVNLSF